MTHSSKKNVKLQWEKKLCNVAAREERAVAPRGGRWSKCAVSFMQTDGNDANDSHYMHIVEAPGGAGCGGSMHRCTDVQ